MKPIICVPIVANFEYCFECKKVTPFKCGYCICCHSACPLGDPCDEEISVEDWHKNMMEAINISEITDSDSEIFKYLNDL